MPFLGLRVRFPPRAPSLLRHHLPNWLSRPPQMEALTLRNRSAAGGSRHYGDRFSLKPHRAATRSTRLVGDGHRHERDAGIGSGDRRGTCKGGGGACKTVRGRFSQARTNSGLTVGRRLNETAPQCIIVAVAHHWIKKSECESRTYGKSA